MTRQTSLPDHCHLVQRSICRKLYRKPPWRARFMQPRKRPENTYHLLWLIIGSLKYDEKRRIT